jgi:2-oxoglutarate dehydrogenase E1 component
MYCYRRHGHNEGDDPSYTQPILYRKIKDHPSTAKQYGDRLIREGVLTPEELDGIKRSISSRLEEAFDTVQKKAERFELQDLSLVTGEDYAASCPRTSVNEHVLDRVIRGSTHFPESFHLHPKLRGFVEKRRDVIAKGGSIDWAFGEALAFGTLALEGTPIRLSGQDSGRGTFSQRHLAFYDFETSKRYVPMQHIAPGQGRFEVFDSSLSEYAVLGFEFGYSVADPFTLVIWEAQFGDFANGAQIMIDQFISCCEQKWGQPSGLVMLLPHGFEGQGPEHSSARIERFLVLCAENNMLVANCTTPAQYFHLLRRQMYGGPDRRGTRKPLVIFTPKSLLRHPRAVSTIHDFTGSGFIEILPDTTDDPKTVSRVVFCSGKVYYDLLLAREERKAEHIALVRVEQLYPFAADQAAEILGAYAKTAEVIWAQEEPRNMGAWHFIQDKMASVLDPTNREIRYVGRPESASPATGSGKRHQAEQAAIVEDALTRGAVSAPKLVRKKKS